MKSTKTKTKFLSDIKLYYAVFGTLCAIASIISHPVKTSGQVKNFAWTLQQMTLCIPLHLAVTYCVSRSVINFQLIRKNQVRKSIHNHAFAGMLATSHALHCWYKLVKGEPIKGLGEVILIGMWNVLPCAYVTFGGTMLLPYIPEKTDLTYVKMFVSMLFICLLQQGVVLVRCLWVIAAGHNPSSVFLRSLGKAIGVFGITFSVVGFFLFSLPIFDWLKLWNNGLIKNGKASSAPQSDKKKRSVKWFFWDLWFVPVDAIDSELLSKTGMAVNVCGFMVATCFLTSVMLFVSSPPDGSGLDAAIKENNVTFLSMAVFLEALASSCVVTMMFDGSLVIIGRKSTADLEHELLVVTMCTLVFWIVLGNGVLENFPAFFNMMMMY
mmetsp:Transcript_1464/g.2162  ORF Transcript_1464/g.2162 Transcript_1464/m.2162 type:complete len:381 (+) Transcript_1464:82-1224(+)|eukprot:CAMPEP_0194211278 /NCGR_PEP_ID=MMETSP0156-20130528/9889_1 /TAXON_ID=33649 /ORGANISM="Thalassionema nitzschioides, Strain L26-B" /LENGTH=380 /DNA_ID=CAMNT_0038938787 /DNA_START=32 /DNA_END=1174 /DNA_ORIENTATION=-